MGKRNNNVGLFYIVSNLLFIEINLFINKSIKINIFCRKPNNSILLEISVHIICYVCFIKIWNINTNENQNKC